MVLYEQKHMERFSTTMYHFHVPLNLMLIAALNIWIIEFSCLAVIDPFVNEGRVTSYICYMNYIY